MGIDTIKSDLIKHYEMTKEKLLSEKESQYRCDTILYMYLGDMRITASILALNLDTPEYKTDYEQLEKNIHHGYKLPW